MYRDLIQNIVSLMIALLICWNTQAQPQDITWCYAIDSLIGEEITSTVFDNECNIYVAINYQTMKYREQHGPVNYRTENHQSLLLKFDTLGQVIWHQNISSSLDVRLAAIAIAPNGDVLVTGSGDGQIEISDAIVDIPVSQSSDFYRGLFIARLSKEGIFQWVQYWQSETWVTALTIAVSQKDEIYLGYVHQGKLKNKGQLIENYIEQPKPYHYRQLALAKLNHKGVKLESFVLSQDYSGSGDLLGIQFDKSNNMILYGKYQGNLSLPYTEPIHNSKQSGLNSYIAKYLQTDSLFWMKEIGGLHDQSISDIAIAPDQSIYVTGIYNRECILSDRRIVFSNSFYDEDSDINFGNNFFFCHLFPDGTIDFVQYKYHTSTSPFFFKTKAIAVDEQGLIHHVGVYQGKLELAGKKLESSWYQTQPFYALWRDEQLEELSKLSDAPYGKFTAENFDIGNHHFVGSARYDFKDTYINIKDQKVFLPQPNGWPVSFIYGGILSRNRSNNYIANSDSPGGISFNQEIAKDRIRDSPPLTSSPFNEDSIVTTSTSVDVTLFPNPANDQVNLRFNKNLEAIELALFSNSGQLLFVQQLNKVSKDHVLSLDIDQLPAGIYFFKLNNKRQEKVLSFVKQ